MNMHAGVEPRPAKTVLVKDIIHVVADQYRVSVTHMLSRRRQVCLMRPRHVAMYLARELTPASFLQIGRMMGGRDHATIMNGFEKINRLLQTDVNLRQKVANIRYILISWQDDGQMLLPFPDAVEAPIDPEAKAAADKEAGEYAKRRAEVAALLRRKTPELAITGEGHHIPPDVALYRLRRATLAHLIDLKREGGRWE